MKAGWAWIKVLLVASISMGLGAMGWQESEAAENHLAADPTIAALEREKKILELKGDIAEARGELAAAGFPTSETKGLQGSVTLGEGAGYFSELAAYATLSAAAGSIAAAIGEASSKKRKIVVTNEMEPDRKRRLWNVVDKRLKWYLDDMGTLTRQLELITEVAKLGSPEAVASRLPLMLGGLADIASFFKTDLEVTARPLTLAEGVLTAELARELERNNWTVMVSGMNAAGTNRLLALLDNGEGIRRNLMTEHARVKSLVATELAKRPDIRRDAKRKEEELKSQQDDRERTGIQAELDELKTQEERVNKIELTWNEIDKTVVAVSDAYVEYRKGITEPRDGDPSVVEELGVVDELGLSGAVGCGAEEKTERDSHCLARVHVQVVSQGGEVRVKKRLWSSGKLSYVGGSVSMYLWFAENGRLQGSGSFPLVRRVPDAAFKRVPLMEFESENAVGASGEGNSSSN